MSDAPSFRLPTLAAMRLDRTEIGGEFELPLAGQRLARKHDNVMGENSGADRPDEIGRKRPRQIERRNLQTALVTLCIGAGMGTATIIERV